MNQDINEDPESPPEVDVDDLDVQGLEELLPEPLLPAYRQFERFQEVRETYGPKVITIVESLLAVVLFGGYIYWLFLFLVQA